MSAAPAALGVPGVNRPAIGSGDNDPRSSGIEHRLDHCPRRPPDEHQNADSKMTCHRGPIGYMDPTCLHYSFRELDLPAAALARVFGACCGTRGPLLIARSVFGKTLNMFGKRLNMHLPPDARGFGTNSVAVSPQASATRRHSHAMITLTLRGDIPQIWSNRGNALRYLDRLDEAEASCPVSVRSFRAPVFFRHRPKAFSCLRLVCGAG